MNSRLRLRVQLLLITVLSLVMTTGVAAAQSSGGGGGGLIGLIENLIQFLQLVVEAFGM